MSWLSSLYDKVIPNEIKPGGDKLSEVDPAKLALSVVGGTLLGPVVAPLAGSLGGAVGGALGNIGAGGVASALGNIAGSTLGSTLLGTGVGALATNTLGGLLGGGSKAAAPTPVSVGTAAPTYDKTLLDTFNAQLAIQPQLLAANQLYQPQWQTLQNQVNTTAAQNQMDLMAKLYQQSAPIEAAYKNQLRQNDIQQLQTTLPQYQQAIQSLTPGYAGAIASTGQLAQGAMARANVAPQLTAFEQQVGTPYGPASMIQAPPLPRAPITEQQQQQMQTVTGPSAPSAPSATQPAALTPPAKVTPTGDQLAPSLPSGIQGPQAPTQAFMDQQSALQRAYQNQLAQNQQIAADQVKLAATPQLTQQQAWGQQPQGFTERMANAVNAQQGFAPVQQQGFIEGMREGQQGFAPVLPRQNAGFMGAINQAPPALQFARAGEYSGAVAGPQLQSDLNRINTGSVNQYVNMMPGMQEAAARMGAEANKELAAGRSLTPEEQRMADQTARSAYAARGTALGNQAIGAEILNRADVANQRYQQRIANANALNAGVRDIYQPALTQSLARQQGAQDYNLSAQQQAFTQAMGKETLLGTVQGTAFSQALQRANAEQQRLQAGTNIQAGQAQLGAGALGQLQAAQQPIMAAYNQQPLLQQTVGQAQNMGLANQAAAGNSLFQPESSMAFQSAFLPYQGNIALQSAQLQANAGKSAGTNSMIGSLGGSLIKTLPTFLGF